MRTSCHQRSFCRPDRAPAQPVSRCESSTRNWRERCATSGSPSGEPGRARRTPRRQRARAMAPRSFPARAPGAIWEAPGASAQGPSAATSWHQTICARSHRWLLHAARRNDTHKRSTACARDAEALAGEGWSAARLCDFRSCARRWVRSKKAKHEAAVAKYESVRRSRRKPKNLSCTPNRLVPWG